LAAKDICEGGGGRIEVPLTDGRAIGRAAGLGRGVFGRGVFGRGACTIGSVLLLL
jgi:hypothetical protein